MKKLTLLQNYTHFTTPWQKFIITHITFYQNTHKYYKFWHVWQDGPQWDLRISPSNNALYLLCDATVPWGVICYEILVICDIIFVICDKCLLFVIKSLFNFFLFISTDDMYSITNDIYFTTNNAPRDGPQPWGDERIS